MDGQAVPKGTVWKDEKRAAVKRPFAFLSLRERALDQVFID
jgi:hypothetical protein